MILERFFWPKLETIIYNQAKGLCRAVGSEDLMAGALPRVAANFFCVEWQS